MTRKLLPALILMLVIAAAVLFVYRFYVLQYTAETLIRRALPDYVRIDKIKLEPERSLIRLENFRLVNPGNFSHRYLVEIASVSCGYRLKGKNILEGFELLEPEFRQPVIAIERLPGGKTNLEAMGDTVKNAAAPAPAAPRLKKNKGLVSKMIGDKKLSDILKLPENFSIRDGKIVFIDRSIGDRPHMITFENIDCSLSLKLDDKYSRVLWVSSEGAGNVSGNAGETVRWVISLDPTTPKLTMSNNFIVSGLDINNFEPYYDKYSPFVFRRGRFSGSLIFDFNNGGIGSTNEIRLSGLLFWIKPGRENAIFWQTSVPELVKYFTSTSGDIVFDFKIKGDMADPQFLLGPISKAALTGMAVDKISAVIAAVAGKSGEAPSGPGAKSDMDKAMEYIDFFKGMIKKE